MLFLVAQDDQTRFDTTTCGDVPAGWPAGITGLLANGYEASAITACDVNAGQLTELQQRFGINTSNDNLASSQAADVVMLAIKPQLMREVCSALSSLPSNPEQLFVSIAAGVPAAAIERGLGGQR